MFLRLVFWGLLVAGSVGVGASVVAWLLSGGIGAALRDAGGEQARDASPDVRLPGLDPLADALRAAGRVLWNGAPVAGVPLGRALMALVFAIAAGLSVARVAARQRRCYVRLRVAPYRTDRATPEAVVDMIEALHQRLAQRWWRRIVVGQPSVALEVHVLAGGNGALQGWLAVCCPHDAQAMVRAAVRSAYPNAHLRPFTARLGRPPCVLRLKKRHEFIRRLALLERDGLDRPLMDRLITTMAATGAPAFVQLALTPAPAVFERHAKARFKEREKQLSKQREQGQRKPLRASSQVEDAELRGGLDVQHRPLCFGDLRVVASTRRACEQIASELRAEGAENRLVERGTTIRRALSRCYDRRIHRGEGNPLPGFHKGVYAATELAALWHAPSVEFATVPFARASMAVAPAAPAILRPAAGPGLLCDERGPVSIHPELRRQNTAVPGTVEQGKTSFLVATVAEDLRRERCAVIVLDPKGDAADAALSLVPEDRVVTLLDFSAPTCGFNPLAIDAPADTIADYTVAALRNLFDDGDIRASSDRYLRYGVIGAVAYDRGATLWDPARLLSVTREGAAYRGRVGHALRQLPQYKEVADFFLEELAVQLRDAKAQTTAKLDAPSNKLARLLSSPQIKRILLNTSLTVDFDRIIANGEVLIVKGATGSLGTDNTAVLMQLLVGMLDAALARQQDRVPAGERVAVALKVDEAPLVINRGFGRTMALKRSAGLETVAAWQTDSQWTDRELRDQLDALFAHRVYFATASADDARAAANLTMAEYADTVRAGDDTLSTLGRPVRLHLPKHWAMASWTTPQGRQPPFLAQTWPITIDAERIAFHKARQHDGGGRLLDDFRQPHWDRGDEPAPSSPSPTLTEPSVAEGQADDSQARLLPEEAVAAPLARPARPADDDRCEMEISALEELRQALRAQTEELMGTLPAAGPPPGTPTAVDAGRVAPGDQGPAGNEGRGSDSDPTRGAGAERPAAEPAASYAELGPVDEARSVRWPRPTALRKLTADPADLEMLAWLCEMRFALATQIHRRFNADKAYTTTQRRLKRLSEAGWVQRFQFFRDTGASSALVYLVTTEGIAAAKGAAGPRGPLLNPRREWKPPSTTDPAMRGARHDLHTTAWVLASQAILGEAVRSVRGPRNSYLAPPSTGIGSDRRPIGPSQLDLPGGRSPAGFLRTDHSRRRRVDVRHFEGLEPDAVLELRLGSGEHVVHTDMCVEVDRTGRADKNVDKFERYDHLIGGWWSTHERYAKYLGGPPAVVFVCRSDDSAREFCRLADTVVTACHAYGGESPSQWIYAGRQRMLFACEQAIHHGSLAGWALPALPPKVRVEEAGGDARAGACHPGLGDLRAVLMSGTDVCGRREAA